MSALFKQALFVAVAFFLSAPASARSVDDCPKLPADANLTWSYLAGPDFDVCYAEERGTHVTAFGVYLGNHPGFDPEQGVRFGVGRVAGKRVVWYRREPTDDDHSPFGRQTVLVLAEARGYVAHLWVVAQTDQQLKSRLSVLERITFER